MKRHIIQALVENKFGVLVRVASLFSARGYNIDSLAVGETLDKEVSCMTVVVNAEDESVLEQIKKQLNKLIDVITVVDLTKKEHIDRELLLVKCSLPKEGREDFFKMKEEFSARLVYEDDTSCILEFSGEHHKVKSFLESVKKFKATELIRTGKIAIAK